MGRRATGVSAGGTSACQRGQSSRIVLLLTIAVSSSQTKGTWRLFQYAQIPARTISAIRARDRCDRLETLRSAWPGPRPRRDLLLAGARPGRVPARLADCMFAHLTQHAPRGHTIDLHLTFT